MSRRAAVLYRGVAAPVVRLGRLQGRVPLNRMAGEILATHGDPGGVPGPAEDQCPADDASPTGVSAAVINYNGQAFLTGCLQSLLAQRPRVSEIVVIDNRSTP